MTADRGAAASSHWSHLLNRPLGEADLDGSGREVTDLDLFIPRIGSGDRDTHQGIPI